MPFEEHGSYRITLDGDILVLELGGAWNAEGVKHCAAEVMRAVDTFQGKQFGTLVNTLPVTGYTPEVMEVWKEVIAYAFPRGISAFARCDDINGHLYKIFNASFDRILAAEIPYTISTVMEEGLAFLYTENLTGFEKGVQSIAPFSHSEASLE